MSIACLQKAQAQNGIDDYAKKFPKAIYKNLTAGVHLLKFKSKIEEDIIRSDVLAYKFDD